MIGITSLRLFRLDLALILMVLAWVVPSFVRAQPSENVEKEFRLTLHGSHLGRSSGGEGLGFSLGGITTVDREGDFNDDSYRDFVVGSPYYSQPTNDGLGEIAETGKITIYLGSASGWTQSIEIVNPTLEEGALFGFSVAGAFDVDGDGVADLIVGAPGSDVLSFGETYVDAGRAWIIPGRADLQDVADPVTWIELTAEGSVLPPPWAGLPSGVQAGSRFGHSVNAIGSDGGGFDDVLVGAPFYDLDPEDPNADLSNPMPGWLADAGLVFAFGAGGVPAAPANGQVLAVPPPLGPQADGLFGFSVTGAGLFDNGGPTFDVAVGEPGRNANAGSAYVFGRVEDPAGNVAYALLCQLFPELAGTPNPSNADDLFGFSISGVGQFNDFFNSADCCDDLVVGAPGDSDPVNPGGIANDGAAYLYFGGLNVNAADPNYLLPWCERSMVLNGVPGERSRFGWSVSGGVNLDGGEATQQGSDEIFVGAPQFGEENEGSYSVYLGREVGAGAVDGDPDCVEVGTDSSMQLGYAVSEAYDVDGVDDGVADADFDEEFLVGASLLDSAGANLPGLFRLRDYDPQGNPSCPLLGAQVGVAAGERFGYAQAIGSDWSGDGISEILVGASYHDLSLGLQETPSDALRAPHDTRANSGQVYVLDGASLSVLLLLQDPDHEVGSLLGSSLSVGNFIGGPEIDVLVGAPRATVGPGQVPAGKVFLYDGALIAASLSAQAPPVLDTVAASLSGLDGDSFGQSIANVGLLDTNSGFDDFVVGAPRLNDGLATASSVELFVGGASAVLSLGRISCPSGNPGTRFGWAVEGLGHIENGSTRMDFAVGAPASGSNGVTSVFAGEGGLFSQIQIAGTNGNFGWSLSRIGDLEGDGLPELLVGAPTDAGGSGSVSVFHLDGNTGAPTLLRTFQGEAFGDRFGWSVSDISSIDPKDSLPDILIGAPRYDENGVLDRGKIYVYRSAGALQATALGEAEGDFFGFSLCRAGTIAPGNSIEDLLVSAPLFDAVSFFQPFAGKVYLLDGDLVWP